MACSIFIDLPSTVSSGESLSDSLVDAQNSFSGGFESAILINVNYRIFFLCSILKMATADLPEIASAENVPVILRIKRRRNEDPANALGN